MAGRLGRYMVLQHLASGGMADVLLARSDGLAGFARYVVLKRIKPVHARDPRFLQMFLAEARVAAGLHHQHIVQVHDVGQDAGEYFMAMEYLHGEDVRTILAGVAHQRRHVPLGHALAIVSATAAGLHYAHERRGLDGRPLGIVHRDISPSNLVVCYDGSIKIVDFGIAKASSDQETRSGLLKGKVAYMSPEQCTGSAIDRRSDVYSLGVVLYELCTTTRLFPDDNDYHVMKQIVGGRIAPPRARRPELPADLSAIILRAIAPDRVQRFATAEELRLAIDDFAVRSGLTATTSSIAAFMRSQFGERPEPWLELAGRSFTSVDPGGAGGLGGAVDPVGAGGPGGAPDALSGPRTLSGPVAGPAPAARAPRSAARGDPASSGPAAATSVARPLAAQAIAMPRCATSRSESKLAWETQGVTRVRRMPGPATIALIAAPLLAVAGVATWRLAVPRDAEAAGAAAGASAVAGAPAGSAAKTGALAGSAAAGGAGASAHRAAAGASVAGGTAGPAAGAGVVGGPAAGGGALAGSVAGGRALAGPAAGAGVAGGAAAGGGSLAGSVVGGGASAGSAAGAGVLAGAVVSGGALAGSAAGGGALAGSAVGGGALAGSAVGGGALAGSAVGGGALAGSAVGGGALAGSAVGGGAFAGGAAGGFAGPAARAGVFWAPAPGAGVFWGAASGAFGAPATAAEAPESVAPAAVAGAMGATSAAVPGAASAAVPGAASSAVGAGAAAGSAATRGAGTSAAQSTPSLPAGSLDTIAGARGGLTVADSAGARDRAVAPSAGQAAHGPAATPATASAPGRAPAAASGPGRALATAGAPNRGLTAGSKPAGRDRGTQAGALRRRKQLASVVPARPAASRQLGAGRTVVAPGAPAERRAPSGKPAATGAASAVSLVPPSLAGPRAAAGPVPRASSSAEAAGAGSAAVPAVAAAGPAPGNAEPALLTHGAIESAAAATRHELQACAGGEPLQGTVDVRFAVDARGKVIRAQLFTGRARPKVAACILRQVQRWQFPPQRQAGAEGTYTLSFR